jgi:GTP pyrophosphokinase
MKMKQKNVGLEQLSDIIAFRIIPETVVECYQILGIIHTTYQMVPDNFQDFISTPKNNGYQSLHTVVIGPYQQKVEIQIRTMEMHEIAELGVAAHWRYKQKYQDAADGRQYRWIQELLSILEQASDPEDFLQNTKLAMYYDQVFCFTPKGNLIALPKGATTVDFAYAVHSNVGNHCVGAKVNGRIVPLRSVLKNGDQVEIVTAKNQNPSPAWEKFIVTGKARSEIRKFVRSQQKEQYTKLGQSIVENILKQEEVKDIPATLVNICSFFKKNDVEELYCDVGEGILAREEIIKQVRPKQSKISSTLSLLKFKTNKTKEAVDYQSDAIPIKGLISGMAMHYAGCCHPIPGDKIVGVIHTGSGVTIHTADCEMLGNFASMPEQIIDLTWDSDKSKIPFICRLKVIILNETGSLAVLSSEVARQQANITNLKIVNRNNDFFEMLVDVETYNVNQLDDIIHSLRSKKCVYQVERYKL